MKFLVYTDLSIFLFQISIDHVSHFFIVFFKFFLGNYIKSFFCLSFELVIAVVARGHACPVAADRKPACFGSVIV